MSGILGINYTFSQTLTNIINKGKTALYLVLEKKPLPIEIIESLKTEVEVRFGIFIEQKKPLLQKIQPDDPEQFLECFLIRAKIEVLKQMLIEKKIKLSEKDLKTFDLIFQKDAKKKENKVKKKNISEGNDNVIKDDEIFVDDGNKNNPSDK